MKLFARFTIIGLVLTMLIAACAPGAAPVEQAAASGSESPAAASNTEASDDAAAATGEKIQVAFWYGLGGALGEVIEEQIAKFNASQDGIEVTGVFQQSYNGVQEKFQAALVSGDVPEIVQIEIHGTPKFASAGALTPLEPFFENDPDFNFDDLIPATLLNQTWDGALYAMPINRSTPVLYYNTQIFSDLGLEPPTTWQEFREVAKTITSGEGGEKVYGFCATPSWWYFESMVWSNGGEIMNEEMTEVTFAEAGAAPLQIWLDMIYTDGTARQFVGETSGEQISQAFANSQCGMRFESTAGLAGIRRAVGDNFKISTAFMPHMEGFETAVPTGGAAAGIPAALSDEKKAAAWEFIKWWISPEQTAYWSKSTGYFPVRYTGVEILEAEGHFAANPEFATTIAQLDFAKAAPSTPFWPAISREIQSAMEDSLVNGTQAIDALTKAQENAQFEIE